MLKSFEELKEFISGLIPGELVENMGEFFEKFSWKKVAAAIGGLFAVLLLSIFFVFGEREAPRATADGNLPIYVKVHSGMNAQEIGEELQRRGIVRNKYKFWLMAKLNGYESRFMAGRYEFHSGMKIEDVLEKLVQGESSEYRFVIPEGFTVLDIAKRLDEEGIVSREDFLRKAKDFAPRDYMKGKEEVTYRAEGFLFPATYTVATDIDADGVLQLMANTFDQRLTPALRRKAKSMDLSIYELVTLASLVEKEARYEEDRPIIAQVFFKRLELGMPLQSDASLQYLMDAPKEDVSIADTKIDSPYNTYQNAGLPPGPVANPGTDSIEAVLHPSETEYLYFVADRDGHNHYAYTYDEHLEIVEQVR